MKSTTFKPNPKRRLFPLVFCFVLLLQSCTVYKSAGITEERAIASTTPLGVLIDKKKYRVKSIYKSHDTLYAFVNNRSKLARNYPHLIEKRTENGGIINLGTLKVDTIYEVDRTTSTISSIFLGVAVVGLLFITAVGTVVLLYVTG